MIKNEKLTSRTNILAVLKKLVGITLGAFVLAFSYNAFVIPFGLLSGGAAGFALTINYIMGIPVQWALFFLNLPLFFWGLKELNKEFVIYSLISMIILVFAIPTMQKVAIISKEIDLFLAAIFSGVFSGLGAGINFKFGSSFGGTDIVSLIFKKKWNVSVGNVSFGCNILVIIISLFFFPVKIALYTGISMWVASRVIDLVVDGLNHHKSVTIITEQNEIIAKKILNELHRGVTYLKGEGGYSRKQELVINCVVNHFEIAKLKEIVLQTDPNAFMFITETVDVTGRGFTHHTKNKQLC